MFGDSGVGIRQEDCRGCFQPYHTTKPDGHGLGLMLVQRIMRAHGGQVGIESKEGVGTVVTLSFPRRTVACASRERETGAMNPDRRHPREQIVATMRRIYRCQMTTSSAETCHPGPDGGIWITPARVDKGELQRRTLFACGRTGRTAAGTHRRRSCRFIAKSTDAGRPQGHRPRASGALVAFSICGLLPRFACNP